MSKTIRYVFSLIQIVWIRYKAFIHFTLDKLIIFNIIVDLVLRKFIFSSREVEGRAL